MTSDTFAFILPLLLMYVVLVGLLVYLLLKVPSGYKLKWLAVPALLISSFFSYDLYVEKLGQPVPIELPTKEFQLVEGRIIGVTKIEIWILEDRRTSRLIVIPYTKSTAENLNKALDRTRKGIPQVGKRKGNQGQGKGEGKGEGKGDSAGGGGWFGIPFLGRDGSQLKDVFRDMFSPSKGALKGERKGKGGGEDGGDMRDEEWVFYDYPHARENSKPIDQK